MKKLALASLILTSTAFSSPTIPKDQQISSFTVEEVTPAQLSAQGMSIPDIVNKSTLGNTSGGVTGGDLPIPAPTPGSEGTPKPTFDDRVQTTSRVIQTLREMVALGEAIYELAKKGRPTNVTEYAPISVVPRDPISKEYIDPFDLEGFSMPIEKNFIAKVKNGNGSEVVNFSYKVIYSYGGSYNGKGKYLTNVMIVPGSIKTSFGWDFSATMKLSGIMNHGSKENPVAGAMVTIKYSMNSWSTAFERNDTIHITGRGELKNHNM